MLGELRCSSASSKQVLMKVPMLSSTQKQQREAETYSSESNLSGARCEVRRRKSLRCSFPVSHLVKTKRLQLLLTATKTTSVLISGIGIKSP